MADKNGVQLDGNIMDTEAVEALDNANENRSACALDSVAFENSQSTRYSKRKASPLYKTVSKRTTPTRSSTFVNMSKSTQSSSQLLLDAFKDSKFLSSITPFIHSMITPTIEKAIETAVSTAVEKIQLNVLDPLMESNNKLKETIESQRSAIADQQSKMADLGRLLEEKSKSILNFEHKVHNLESEVKSLSMASNDLEQYGRRNSIRISNFKADNKLPETELKTQVTAFLNNNVLKNSTQLTESDIDRCHPVGRPSSDGVQQIVVKFINYGSKHLVVSAKKSLRNNPDRIYINEDLTRKNYAILRALRSLQKTGRIYSSWSVNGKIFEKVYETSSPVRLAHMDDIESRLTITR